MRIVVNDIAASCGGAMTILKQFYNYVKENCKDVEWIFILSDNYLEETENIRVVTRPDIKNSNIAKLKFDNFTGGKFINSFSPDAVLSLQNIITKGVKSPQFTYVHQSIPYQTVKKFSFLKSSERGIAKIQYIIGAFIDDSIKKSDGVIVQTKWMKKAVVDKLHISENKVITAMPEIPEVFAKKPGVEFSGKKFLYVTADALYKNNDLIVAACDILNKRGIEDFTVEMTLPQNRYNHKNIVCTGIVDRETLCEKMQGSTALFSSYIETVGLPMLEAQNYGVPVIASDCAFSHEVLENYSNGYFFNPFSAVELADLMEKSIEERITIHEEGGKNGSISEWRKVVEYIVNI